MSFLFLFFGYTDSTACALREDDDQHEQDRRPDEEKVAKLSEIEELLTLLSYSLTFVF